MSDGREEDGGEEEEDEVAREMARWRREVEREGGEAVRR